MDYVDVPDGGNWQPSIDGWPLMAQWENETTVLALRFQPFTPGDVLTVSQITAFLPITALAAQTIDITAAPYNAQPSPADSTAAIQAALNDAATLASAGNPVDVIVPAGTFAYSAVLTVPAYVRLRGEGSVLQATNSATEAVRLDGDEAGALFLTLQLAGTARAGTPDSCGIWVGSRSSGNAVPVHNTLVIGNEVIQPAGAHVFALDEVGGLWAFNYAHDGYADTFHHTGNSAYCQVVANRASESATRGDDLYAFIGYAYNADPVNHCSCIANWGRDGAARGLAAVGAGFVTFQNNDIARTEAAGIYLAREAGYATYGTFNINVVRNLIDSANLNSSHDGLLAYADDPTSSNPTQSFGSLTNTIENLNIDSNTFTNTAAGIGNGWGIEIRSSCDGGAVTNNTVITARTPGIVVNGANYTVSSNTFTP